MNRKKSRFRDWADGITVQTLLSDLSHAVSPERFGPKLSSRVVWRIDTGEPKIALTFDDGPHASSTPEILDTLRRFGVSATFFLVGKHVESNFDVARAIVDGGHEIENHTFSHSLLFLLTNKQMRDEICRTDELLKRMDGAQPRFLRPPVGLFTKRVLDIVEELGYRAVVGDVYPRDPHLPGTEKIVERVIRKTTAGSIIILHDGGTARNVDRSQTVQALDEIIPGLKARGFEFAKLSELISDSLLS